MRFFFEEVEASTCCSFELSTLESCGGFLFGFGLIEGWLRLQTFEASLGSRNWTKTSSIERQTYGDQGSDTTGYGK